MLLEEYQRLATATDQAPGRAEPRRQHGNVEPSRVEVIPLLGLVGEVGSLLAEYKKLLRDGATHRDFKDKMHEELGDILWYVANVASKFDLKLDEIARENLAKLRHRYGQNIKMRFLPDDDQLECAQLPRTFEYCFEHRHVDGAGERLVLVNCTNGEQVGDPLSDNAYEDDGYRFHDVMHLSFAVHFGWSPVYRKLLRKAGVIRHRKPAEKDDAEDGGRAQVAEEAIVLAAYSYATEDLMANATAFDWDLLRHVEKLAAKFEVRVATTGDWNTALIKGFEMWRLLRKHNGGVIRGDLRAGSIEFIPPA